MTGALADYCKLVGAWARRVDLVSPGDLPRFRERHIEDSLRVLPLIEGLPEGPGIDVGSGAGLPGVPLAIAEPGRLWRLLEPRAKRAAFLDEVVRELQLNCEVVRMTAEEAARDRRFHKAHVVATARALAPPARSFELLLPLLAPGAAAFVFVGESAAIPEDADVAATGIARMSAEG